MGKMRVAMPTETSKSFRRFKGFYRLEEEAKQQLYGLLAGCKPEFSILSEAAQAGAVQQMRPLAQRALLNALEGRTQEEEEQFGYDWEDALPRMQAGPLRVAVAQYLLANLPGSIAEALSQPDLLRRDKIEWLYGETVDRIGKFTPYLPSEERALGEWKEQCPQAYTLAEQAARKAAQAYQDRSRRDRSAPATISDEARQLSLTAHLIAARKLYQHVLGLPEYYEGNPTVVGLKVPPEMQADYGTRIYIRLGIAGKAASYREASPRQMAEFAAMLESNLLRNLQEKVCPWTTETAGAQKIDTNVLARAYCQIVKPLDGQEPKGYLDGGTLERLERNPSYYRLLGFRDDIAPEHAQVFEQFLDSNPVLQEFLDRPSVQEAFKARRIDQSLVELALRTAVAHELVQVARQWKPESIASQTSVMTQAQNAIPHIIQDLAAYHDALMQSDYLSVRQTGFFKERLMAEHLGCLSAKERAKIESYYRPTAVALVARDDRSHDPVPADWKVLRSYTDPVTRREFTDYQAELPEGRAILCLRKGASPKAAEDVARRLLDFNQAPRINDGAARVKGVRISELSYNELSSSCLWPISIARMQFYTSFSPSETLDILRGTAEEPTTENLVEALKPCFVLRYSDAYCRIKPAEMVRVKYRTPTGEKKNPCWDASQVLSGLREPAKDPNMLDRLENTKWGLIIIEGEKKGAMLAQMCLERELPYHVISLPGVWMGLMRGKLVPELEQFKMQDASGNKRNCYIFFDNDKAFKAGVTHALVETAAALQRAGARVFVPNLPFGKNIKGADDFALAHCQQGNEIDYQPLIDILEKAIYVSERPRKVKYPSSEQEREINRKLNQAEKVHELQNLLRQKENPAQAPELGQMFMLQAPYLLKSSNERLNAALWDSLNERGRAAFIGSLLKDNPALKLLRQACGLIPSFEEGQTARDFSEGSHPVEERRTVLSPELFAVS
jgi:hypothetical protein